MFGDCAKHRQSLTTPFSIAGLNRREAGEQHAVPIQLPQADMGLDFIPCDIDRSEKWHPKAGARQSVTFTQRRKPSSQALTPCRHVVGEHADRPAKLPKGIDVQLLCLIKNRLADRKCLLVHPQLDFAIQFLNQLSNFFVVHGENLPRERSIAKGREWGQ